MSTITQFKNKYEKVLFWILIVSSSVLPLFVLPGMNIAFSYAKFGLVTFSVLTGLIILILDFLGNKTLEKYPKKVLLGIFLVPFSYAVSSLIHTHSTLGLIGNGAEIDTFFSVLLGSFSILLISKVFRSNRSVFSYFLILTSISTLILLFHTLRFFFGPSFLSFGVFNSITANTIGSFGELGIYAALTMLISLLILELVSVQKRLKIALYVSLVLSYIVLLVTNFSIVLNLLGTGIPLTLLALTTIFVLFIFIHKKVTSHQRGLPKVSLIVLLVLILTTIMSNQIQSLVTPHIAFQENETLDVRVTPSASVDLALKQYSEGVVPMLFGTGPNTFYSAWASYKPVNGPDSVNITPFWNVDFNLASGFIPTAFVTSGILGGISWVWFILLVVYFVSKLIRKVTTTGSDSVTVCVSWIASIATVFLWTMVVLYTTGVTILFMAYISTGMLFALLIKEGIFETTEFVQQASTYWKNFMVTFVLVIGIISCIYIAFIWQQRVYASIQVQKATSVLSSNPQKITEAQNLMLKALNAYFNPSDLRYASEMLLVRPIKLINSAQGVVAPQNMTQEVLNDISFSINSVRRAAIDRGLSRDYKDWLQLGKVYEAATFLGATSTASLAVQAYAEAERLNPTSPIPPYNIGRIYALAREFKAAEEKLMKAVELKPDYIEALNLLETVKKGNQSVRDIPLIQQSASSTATTTPKK